MQESENLTSKTILMLGRTGAGKSRCCNKLSNSTKFEESASLKSKTKEPKNASFTLTVGKRTERINLIDTPGFADNRKTPDGKSFGVIAI